MNEREYNTKSDPRLSADDVLKRAKLHEYQNTYAAAMSEFGLKRGIVGSTARHIATSTHYKQQMQQLEENIANLQEEVEKSKEGKSTLLAIFGKDDLAKARKELASKNEELAKLQAQIAKLEAEKASLKQKHEAEIAKLRNVIRRKLMQPSGVRKSQSGKQPIRRLSLKDRRTGLKNLTARPTLNGTSFHQKRNSSVIASLVTTLIPSP